jgi:hypothetical protein
MSCGQTDSESPTLASKKTVKLASTSEVRDFSGEYQRVDAAVNNYWPLVALVKIRNDRALLAS